MSDLDVAIQIADTVRRHGCRCATCRFLSTVDASLDRPIAAKKRRVTGDSIQERIAAVFATAAGQVSPSDLAKATDCNIESVRAALSKLVAAGRARRVATNLYEWTERTFRSMAELDAAYFPNVDPKELGK